MKMGSVSVGFALVLRKSGDGSAGRQMRVVGKFTRKEVSVFEGKPVGLIEEDEDVRE